MGLRLKSTQSFGRKIAILTAVFALVAQPMYGFVASQIANAAGPTTALHAAPLAAAQNTQVVKQSDFANAGTTWTYHSDVTEVADPSPTTNHEVVSNPVSAVGDNGAVRLNSEVGDKWNLASLQYSGTRLADVAALGFDLYTDAPGKAYINLDVDFNHPSISGWQGRLVYIPSGVTANTWGSHEAVAGNGQWQWSLMVTGAESAWPDGNTSASRNWNDIVTAFPEATITAIDNVAFGSLYLRADGVSQTYYDYVYLATASKNVRYNFERESAQPVVTSVTPAEGSYIKGATQRININVENLGDVRGGYLQLNKAVESGNPLNDSRTNFPLQNDENGWFAVVDTTNIVKHSERNDGGLHQGDGKYLFKVEAYGYGTSHGYYGNNSGWFSHSHHFIVDNSAPEVLNATLNDQAVTIARSQNCGPTNFNLIGSSFNLGITTDDEAGTAGVRYRVAKVTDGGCTQTSVYRSGWVTMTNTGSEAWEGPVFDTTVVPADGNYTIEIETRDVLDNTINHRYVDIAVDKTAPSAPVLSSTNLSNGGYTNQNSVNLNWTKPSDDTANYEYRYWNNIDGNNWTASNPWTTEVSAESRTGAFTEGEGTHYMQVVAIDHVGNRSEPSNVFSVTYDNTAPEVNIFSATLASENTLEFTGEVYDPNFSHYYCWLTRTTGGEVGARGENCVTTWASDLQRNGNPATNNPTGTGGEVVLGAIDVTGLEDGDYVVRVGVVDRAGNRNTTETFDVNVDRSQFTDDEEVDTNVLAPDGPGVAPPRSGGGSDNVGGAPSRGTTGGNTPSGVAVQGAQTFSGSTFSPLANTGTPLFAVASLASNSADEEDEEEDVAVLGEEDRIAQVSGENTTTGNTDDADDEGCGSFLGLCWYWWVAIAIGVAAIIYLVRSLRAGKGEDQPA